MLYATHIIHNRITALSKRTISSYTYRIYFNKNANKLAFTYIQHNIQHKQHNDMRRQKQ